MLSPKRAFCYLEKRLKRGGRLQTVSGRKKGDVLFDGPVIIPCLHERDQCGTRWRETPVDGHHAHGDDGAQAGYTACEGPRARRRPRAGGDIDALSEDVVLMPFERTLARQCLSQRGYKKVIQWQMGTQIEWWDPKTDRYYGTLHDVPNYTRHALWLESFRGLRRMGAIKNGRVTWRWPNWGRAPKYLLARGNLIGGY